MSRSYKGQTVLEYMIIAMVIMAGIVVGGPFLVDSVKGHFRLLEDSALDSVSEDIRQAGPPNLSTGPCNCGDWVKWAMCGHPDCGGDMTQRYYYRDCTPDNCKKEFECRVEDDCCEEVTMERCGTILDIGDPCPESGRTAPTVFPAGFKGTCPGGNCKVWERLYSINCGSGAYQACKDVKSETPYDCGPTCWDLSSAVGTTNSGKETNLANLPSFDFFPAPECNGSETDRDTLEQEIYTRLNTPDTPPRGVDSHPEIPRQMFRAFRVINTYFDPAKSGDCDADRRCEFLCPTGYSPAPVTLGSKTFANATCKPCYKGTVQVAVFKNSTAPSSGYDTLLYTSPHMSEVTNFETIVNDAQNFIGGGINSNDGHCEYFSNHANNRMGTCYAAVRTTFTVEGNAGTYCMNWQNFNTGPRFAADYTPGGTYSGHNYALAIMRHKQDQEPITAMRAHIQWVNPDYKICTAATLPVVLSATDEGTLYAAKADGSKGAYIGYSLRIATRPILVPQETSGTSYLFLDCPVGSCSLSGPGICFEVDGTPGCAASFSGNNKIKLTY